jgi:HK97 family phage prohead protease
MSQLELRITTYPITTRSSGKANADSPGTIRGYASVFDSASEDLGYSEIVKPGAFRNTLLRKPDVRALVNHNPSLMIGRTRNGSLKLSEDGHGLLTEITLPNTTTGRDLYELVRANYINQMSFGFHVIQDRWPSPKRRELVEVDLAGGDVSVVSFPAYSATTAEARDQLQQQQYRSVGHYARADWRPYQPVFSVPYEQLSDDDKAVEDMHLDSWVRHSM